MVPTQLEDMIKEVEGWLLWILNRVWEVINNLKDIIEELEYDPSPAPPADFDPLCTIGKYCWFQKKMSNPSSPTDPNTTTSSDNHPLDLFAPELSDLVSDPEMIEHIHTAFSDNPIRSMLIRYYQHVSLSITWMVDILDQHYKERNDLFQYTITNPGFHQGIQLVIRDYRRRQQ